MASILAIMPETITGGESISVNVKLDDYSPATHALKYRFGIDGVTFEATGVDDDAGGWNVAVTPTQTALIPTGRLSFDALVTAGETVAILVDQGSTASRAAPTRVSSWQAVITAIDTAIAEAGANGQGSVSVDGMSVSYRNPHDLVTLRAFAVRRMQAERSGGGLHIIRTRFNV